MNYCIITEDEQSLLQVLPYWLQYLDFPCQRVEKISNIQDNNYTLQSGCGIYQLIDEVLLKTIDRIIEHDKHIDYLIIILDADESSIENRVVKVETKIKDYCRNSKLDLKSKVIVCNCCFETWLLCNSKLYPINTPPSDSPFYKFYTYYNVRDLDPEKMEKSIIPFKNTKTTKAGFHFNYLHEMCKYNNMTYRKNNAKVARRKDFFDEIVDRTNTTNHGKSFKFFCDYIKSLH